MQATELAQTLETVGKLAQLNAGSSGGAALLQLVEQARATARHVTSHIAHTRCPVEESPATCSIVTGYLLVRAGSSRNAVEFVCPEAGRF